MTGSGHDNVSRDLELQSRVAAMMQELSKADSLFRPARFWELVNESNNNFLDRDGFMNFKRTINGNYFNWVPHSFNDNQLRNLFLRWARNPDPIPLMLEMPADGYFRLWSGHSEVLQSEERRGVYKFFVGLLWSFAASNDAKKLTARLSEPDLGNPLPITLQGRLISQDLANSIREFYVANTAIEAVSRPTVAELGAGYGRLGYVFAAAHPCRYLIFDIPPALAVSERYLSAVYPDKRLFRFRHFDTFEEVQSEIDNCDFGFFTSNQLVLFPNAYFDLAISISALHEMYIPQISNYLTLLNRTTKAGIYLKNWKIAKNPWNDTIIDDAAYNPGAEWGAAINREDSVQNLFMEKLFLRKGTEGATLAKNAANFPTSYRFGH
jgi:putative sugar O-methyltransferase